MSNPYYTPGTVTRFTLARSTSITAQLAAIGTAFDTLHTSLVNIGQGSSVTSLTIGTGSKSLTITSASFIQVGQSVRIAYSSGVSNYMDGQVTAWDSTTGAATVNVTSSAGSGTYATWAVSITPAAGSFLSLLGGTLTGALTTATPASGQEALIIPHGAAPSAPTNGSLWTTTAGAFAQINGSTKQVAMLGDASLGDFSGPASSTDNAIVRFNGTGGKTGQNSAATVSDDGVIRSATNSGANAVVVPLLNWMQLTADYTLTSTTSAQKLFDGTATGRLALPLGIYRFKMMLYITGMSATSGNIAVSWAGSNGATIARYIHHVVGIDSTTPLDAAAQTGSAAIANALSPASMVTAAVGTGAFLEVNGMFEVTVVGDGFIPWCQLVTAAAAVVKAGSYVMVEKIGESSEAYVGDWD